MKSKILLLALVSVFSLQPSAVLAQGGLTPPGAPAPTMLSLNQIEPRTPISSAPFTITVPGSYYLTTNLAAYGFVNRNGIIIATNGVTLDLNGFTISSASATAQACGILLTNALSDISIVNGHIRSGVTNNSSGVYGGTGFAYGIYASTAPVNVVISKVSVAGVLDDGINVGTGNATVVEACTVTTAGGNGIVASTTKSSVAIGCGGSGIYGDQVADCRGISSGGGCGVYANATAQNCYGQSAAGYGLYACLTAQNCYGYNNIGGIGYWGLYAYTAENCYGYSNGSGGGLVVFYTAQNCYGYSNSGMGLGAETALNCCGICQEGTGTGLNTTIANSCYCYSESGTALLAILATSCFIGGGSVNITYKYNMP